MPTYIMLSNFTDQGIKDIKNEPQRIEEAINRAEAMGGKVLGVYLVMGEYDIVAIGEAPNDETAMTFLLWLGSLGYGRTKTLKAFTKEEFAEMAKKLP